MIPERACSHRSCSALKPGMHFEHVIEPGPVVNSPAPHVEHVRLFGFGATVFFAQGKQEANPAASATVPGWQGRQ